MPYKDPEKRKKHGKTYMAKWRKENPDKVKAIAEKSLPKKREYAKNHYQENEEQMKLRSKLKYKSNYKWYKSYREKNKDKKKNTRLKKEFGITLEEYNKILQQQGGLCAICGKPETVKNQGGVRPLSIDHDHETKKVRGLLCSNCNNGLGRFYDNPVFLSNALSYILKGKR